MTECDYCGASVPEDDYLDHLGDEHYDALGRIDRRRVDDASGEERDVPTGPIALLAIVGITVAAIVYLAFFSGSSAATVEGHEVAQTPTDLRSQHTHGPIDVTIAGEELNFSRAEYQRYRQYPAFHFEPGAGEGELWHVHAEGVTLEYAMATLGIGVTETSVTFEGTTYRDADPDWKVSVTVNGDPVDPATYVLEGVGDLEAAHERGDHVRIVVRAT